ncbi:MAG: KH domain-containing protein [Clostridia bacterium]|nr:KH domain-containing protein [Clostridia bacterium]
MQKLVEYIVKELVDNKEAVKVVQTEDADGFVINVKVAPDETGRVVGKSGKNAQAIRTIVRSLAGKHGYSDKKFIVKFD